jgi:1-aminocyclopropane-1-carboxylate deaminase
MTKLHLDLLTLSRFLFLILCPLSCGMHTLAYTETPVLEIDVSAPIKLLVKEEYKNHPFVSGNKWWKLKYNLEEAKRLGLQTLLTFGGAYSNHIYATAAAARACGFHSIGIIRGEEPVPLNRTLQFAKDCGMHLHYVSRYEYRLKTQPAFIQKLLSSYGDCYILPEGGANALAVKGCEELARLLTPLQADYICLPVGTGGTMAGIIKGAGATTTVLGFPVLKEGDFLRDEIRQLVNDPQKTNWNLVTDYHFGGYANTTQELLAFIHRMEQQYGIPLDHVYTGKMLYGVLDLVTKGFFPRNATVLLLHTGGLQGKLPSM